ncbi:MAG: hypothetical protein AB7G76_02900 [Steroidobacteraceae bacterium]
MVVAATGWLIVAGSGILASRGLPWGQRLALVIALWGLSWPAVRRDLALRSRTSIHCIAHRPPGDWYLELGDDTVPAVPSPHSMALGGALWLAFETSRGMRRACVVDRALAARLRLAYRGPRARARRAVRMTPDT